MHQKRVFVGAINLLAGVGFAFLPPLTPTRSFPRPPRAAAAEEPSSESLQDSDLWEPGNTQSRQAGAARSARGGTPPPAEPQPPTGPPLGPGAGLEGGRLTPRAQPPSSSRKRSGPAKRRDIGGQVPLDPPGWVSEERAVAAGRERLGAGQQLQQRAGRRYRSAVEADKRGDLDKSERLLLESTQIWPYDGRCWRRLARLANQRGDPALAELRLRQVGSRVCPVSCARLLARLRNAFRAAALCVCARLCCLQLARGVVL